MLMIDYKKRKIEHTSICVHFFNHIIELYTEYRYNTCVIK